MFTFTCAGDEAGDISFAFEKGASRYFVVTVIATQEPESLRVLLDDVRQKAHLPKGFDFHFNSLASAKIRNLVFETLDNSNFEAWELSWTKPYCPIRSNSSFQDWIFTYILFQS